MPVAHPIGQPSPAPTRSARSPAAHQPSPPNSISSARRRRAASSAPASYLRVDTHHATSLLRFLVNQFRGSCSTVLVAVAHVRPADLDDDDDERDSALRAVVVALRQAIAHANAVTQYLTSFASVSDATLNGLRAQARIAVDALLAVSTAPEAGVEEDAEKQGGGLIAFVRQFGDLARRVYDMVDCYTALGRVATPTEIAAADHRTLLSNQVPAAAKPGSVPRDLSTAPRSPHPDAGHDAALRRRSSSPRSPAPPTPTSKRTASHDAAQAAADVARLTDLSRAAALVAEQAAAAATAMSAPDPTARPAPRPRSPARNPYADRPLLDVSRKTWRHEWTETRVDVTGRTQPACGLCNGSFKFIERRVLCRACRMTVHAACFDGGHPEWIECGVYGPGEGVEEAKMRFPKWSACCPGDNVAPEVEKKDGVAQAQAPMPMQTARCGRRPSPPRSWEPMVKIGSRETLLPPPAGADAWRTAPTTAHHGRPGSMASSSRNARPPSVSSRGRTVPPDGSEHEIGAELRESPPPMLPSLESLLENGKAWISLDSPSLYAALRGTSSAESQHQRPPLGSAGGTAPARRLGQQHGDAGGY
ncbi:hypothetical protein AMAG_01369 [Allomyces macrogynus ATCC 38327]|uniref:Phorbol-ester/DAG-type domain-containing protein n=1 Tax=Allomyces macrogynus (strain ATCC 38327) TaxID=578462 RepID=A0A0L0RYS0_ALLM3|nr:hypothetical protein AMAG_01369 [Allomyces macrogynus ATCC 38327]|eukprot:KNE55478.1 hypothetical protein AMAG_01369 [Allomyces macrogynus ATCC 38327]